MSYGTSEIDSSVQVLRIMTETGTQLVKVSGRLSAELLKKIGMMLKNHELEVKGLRTCWFGGGEGHVDMKKLKGIYATEGIALTTIPDRMLELRFQDAEGKVKYLSEATEEERRLLKQPAWGPDSVKMVNRRAGFRLNPNGRLTVLPSEFDDFAKEHGIRWYGYPDYGSADGMHYIATGADQLALIQPFVETWMKNRVTEKTKEMDTTADRIKEIDEELKSLDQVDVRRAELLEKRKNYVATMSVQELELKGIKAEAEIAGKTVTEEDYIRSNCEEWQKNPEMVEELCEKGVKPMEKLDRESLLGKTVSRQDAVQILFCAEQDDLVIEKLVSPAPEEMKEKTGCLYHAVYTVRNTADGSDLLRYDDGEFSHEQWKEKAEELIKTAGFPENAAIHKEISIESVLKRQEVLAEQAQKAKQVKQGNAMTPAAEKLVEQERKQIEKEELMQDDFAEITVPEEDVMLHIPEADPNDLQDFDKGAPESKADVILFRGTENEANLTVSVRDLKKGSVRIRKDRTYDLSKDGETLKVSGDKLLSVWRKYKAPVKLPQRRAMSHGR